MASRGAKRAYCPPTDAPEGPNGGRPEAQPAPRDDGHHGSRPRARDPQPALHDVREPAAAGRGLRAAEDPRGAAHPAARAPAAGRGPTPRRRGQRLPQPGARLRGEARGGGPRAAGRRPAALRRGRERAPGDPPALLARPRRPLRAGRPGPAAHGPHESGGQRPAGHGRVRRRAAGRDPRPRAGREIRITDTGPGISPELQEKIFRPWFSTKEGGTGLGLPTTRRIVEELGGEMRLQSEVGRGTRFTLSVPRPPRQLLPAGSEEAR